MKSKTALLIIDMLNTLDFPEGPMLAKQALPVAKNILKLKKKMAKRGAAVVYVNDNFGNWKSSWEEVYKTCAAPKSRGREIAKILHPDPEDYFILKPRHSAFYSTNLEVFLKDLGIENLILTGVAGNICILFTVHDAHMRDFKITVPRDCIASNTKTLNDQALGLMKNELKVQTPISASISL
ncbi:cysteine hydrolase family protein [Bdellovibrio bacteriovorus]|uniref:cysteine hydrolase family protein n=1 Tax=Bdellovibrio bacteriovorus TaxID=959 RepID=UPI001C12C890|nr:isochorismatase family cysteine hydrolase [Bdellovibrio bacteriovorus]